MELERTPPATVPDYEAGKTAFSHAAEWFDLAFHRGYRFRTILIYEKVPQ
jgi:hypothetical protein